MFLIPFLKYLKPHRLRLAFAICCMVGVGFFGTYNYFLFKPALDVIFFDEDVLNKYVQDNEERIAERQEKLQGFLSSEDRLKRLEGRAKSLYYPLETQVRRLIIHGYTYAAEHRTRSLRWIALFLIVASLVNGFFEYGFRFNLSYSLYSAVLEMKADIFRHIMRQDMRFFTDKSVGFLMSRITSDVISLRTIFDMLIKNGVLEAIRLVFIISALLVLSVKLTAIVFLAVLPAIGIILYFARLIKKVTRKQKRKADVLSSVMNESLGNIRLIKSFNTESIECKKFDLHNRKLLYYEMKRRIARFAASPIMELLGAVGLSVILMLAGFIVIRDQEISPTGFLLYLGFLTQFYKPLKHISKVNVSWQTGVVSAQRIQEILSIRPTVVDPASDSPRVKLDRIAQGISVRNVVFRYEDKTILDHVSLEIPAGRTTAIVGQSGSGKSTIANLILRLYDPDEGAILLDGHDLRSLRLADLRAHFGIVTQETILFNETIAGNIAYGCEDEIDMARVEQAARAAYAHEFIMNLDGDQGYQSPVGPAGSMLSGGQRQRIAIARAFYRDPQILILDEATSSLDTQSEAAVHEALERLMANRTVLVISHRLSTIQKADKILVLHAGRIVESGTHQQLLALDGYYAEMCRHGDMAAH